MGGQAPHTTAFGNSNRFSFWKFVKKIKIWGLAPLGSLRDGNIVTESDEGKATLFANLLAIQNVSVAHLTATVAFQHLSLSLPDVHVLLELVNVGEVQAIVEALPQRRAPGSHGLTNEIQKKLPLTEIICTS
jgi:hypothetical protein